MSLWIWSVSVFTSAFATDSLKNQMPCLAIIALLPFSSAYANEIMTSMNVGGVWFGCRFKLFVTPDCSFNDEKRQKSQECRRGKKWRFHSMCVEKNEDIYISILTLVTHDCVFIWCVKWYSNCVSLGAVTHNHKSNINE